VLHAALPLRCAERLCLSGPVCPFLLPPHRLEGSAFQTARRRLAVISPPRKGGAFPHSKRRSRRSSVIRQTVIWTRAEDRSPLPAVSQMCPSPSRAKTTNLNDWKLPSDSRVVVARAPVVGVRGSSRAKTTDPNDHWMLIRVWEEPQTANAAVCATMLRYTRSIGAGRTADLKRGGLRHALLRAALL
jgi:hypothetical protein